MLLARAFVLTANARGALAVILVASSVTYALVAGAAVEGLQEASETLDPDLARPERLLARPGLAPFPRAELPPNATVLSHAIDGNVTYGTIEPWRYRADAALPGPYAARPAEPPEGLRWGNVTADPHAPWGWILLPPEGFAARFPALEGQATAAFAEGVAGEAAPAAFAFYTQGADQVRSGVHLVVLSMGFTAAALSAGVVRLELLARERDLATLEALGGARLVRRVVLLRALALASAGTLLGVLIGEGIALAARRVLDAEDLALPPLLVAEAALVTLLAATVAGALAARSALRRPLTARLGARGISARRFPGPVRFTLVTPRVGTSMLVAALILTSISGVVLAAATLPYELFGTDEDVHVLGRAENNPFRGSASRFFGEHATTLDGVQGSSPEIVVPTSLGGVPFLARGAHLESWRAIDEPALVAGGWPDAPGEASIGWRLARALDLAPGDAVVLPGAYRATFASLTIVAVHRTGNVLDDELVIPLDEAASLAEIRPDRVHLIRLRASEEVFSSLASQPLLRVVEMEIVPPEPIPHTRAMVRLTLLNLRDGETTRELAVRVNGIAVATATATAAAREEVRLDIPFLVPAAPSLVVTVNPTVEANTTSPQLTVLAPSRVAVGANFTARVLDAQGAPVVGANVTLDDNASATTDEAGNATLLAPRVGELALTARAADGRQGARLVAAVDPARAFQPQLHVTTFARNGTAPWNETHVEQRLIVTLVNVGGASYNGTLPVVADGAFVVNVTVSVPVGATRSLDLALRIPSATRNLTLLDATLPLLGGEGANVSSRTVEDMLREKALARRGAGAGAELRGEALVQDVFADLEPAVALVVLATFAQAGCIVVVAVLRETREREEVATLLAALGASPEQISLRAAREALLSAILPILLGVGLAVLAFRIAGAAGAPAAFGHTVAPAFELGFLLRIVLALSAVAALTAYWATGASRRREEPPSAEPASVASLWEARG